MKVFRRDARLSEGPAGTEGGSSDSTAAAGANRRVAAGVAVAIVVVAAVIALVATSGPSPSATVGTSSTTSISDSAVAIVASVVQASPAGFSNESSKARPSSTVDWVELQNINDGSSANVTVMIFASTNESLTYFGRVVADEGGLPGYSVINSTLASYQQYGSCYAYGEDTSDGISVVNGLCTKGNVFLEVHLISGISFTALEDDLTTIMGAAYQSAT